MEIQYVNNFIAVVGGVLIGALIAIALGVATANLLGATVGAIYGASMVTWFNYMDSK